jgi:hypothetical protein
VDTPYPIGIFLLSSYRKSMQLCGFPWIRFSPSISQLHSIPLLLHLQLSLLLSKQWIAFPPLFVPSQIAPLVLGWAVCWHRMCRAHFWIPAIFTKARKSRRFSPGCLLFLHKSLLSRQPLLPSSYCTLRLLVIPPLLTRPPGFLHV